MPAIDTNLEENLSGLVAVDVEAHIDHAEWLMKFLSIRLFARSWSANQRPEKISRRHIPDSCSNGKGIIHLDEFLIDLTMLGNLLQQPSAYKQHIFLAPLAV
jgi:hypothetical protein